MAIQVIAPKTSRLGDVQIDRLLPRRECRMVGPFIFLDHMGPVQFESGDGLEVLPHPHIGLSTLTWLFEGALHHRDSLGSDQIIRPGECNLMTSGKGIVHSERTPKDLRQTAHRLHGLQFWIALPKQQEQCEAEFQHFKQSELPVFEKDNAQVELVIGELFGQRSPAPMTSPTLLVQCRAIRPSILSLKPPANHQWAWLPIRGLSTLTMANDSVPSQPDHLYLLDRTTELKLEADCFGVLFGGERWDSVPVINWNFVASSKSLIEQARQRWKAQTWFEPVPDETDFVPLPD